MKNKKVYIFLFLIAVCGIFLRFYKLGDTAFDRDEFFELNSSYGYHKTGELVAWNFGSDEPFNEQMQDDSSNERAEFFRWQLAQLYNFAEPSEGLTRGLGAAWGVLAILLVYFVTFSMTGNRYIGLIAAFLTAFGQTEVLYSRRLRMYAMLFPTYLFFAWTVFKFYESKYKGKIKLFHKIQKKIDVNVAYLILVIISGLVSYDTHIISAHIIPTIIIYTAILILPSIISYYTKEKISGKALLSNKYFLTVATGILGLLIYQSQPEIISNLRKTIKKSFKFFLDNPNYDFINQYFSDFAYLTIGIILTVLGIYFLIKKLNKKKEAAYLTSAMLVPLAFAIFTWRRDNSHRYIYFIHSFVIILSSVGIYAIISLVTEKFKKRFYRILLTLLILTLSFFSLDLEYISPDSDMYTQSSYYPDFKPAFNYIIQNKKPGDVMITRAYRSFYWKGEPIKTFDVKSLRFGSSGCENKIDQIVQTYPRGWVVFPKIDKITVCEAGRSYYDKNLVRVKKESIPSSVKIYYWDNNKN